MAQEEPKSRKPSGRRPRSRRKAESAIGEGAYNPGQIALLLDLLREFSQHVQVDVKDSNGELTVRLESDLPHLESFIGFKVRDLVSQQDRLAQLWEVSAAG